MAKTYYTKHHLKFGKNQADNLVAVFNSLMLKTGLYWISVQIFSCILLVFSIKMQSDIQAAFFVHILI